MFFNVRLTAGLCIFMLKVAQERCRQACR